MRAALLLILGVVACNPYESDFGGTPFLCGPTEPRCPNGYTCLEDNGREVCFEDGSQSGDERCGDDGALEPNNSVDMATPTPLDTMRTYSLENLTICPAVDKDNYAVTLQTTNEGIEVIVDFAPEGAMLRAAILNQTGIPIATASPVADTPTMIRAHAQNLPAGAYIVQVSGSEVAALMHAYKVTINVTGP
jgi:hypothetical protein